MKIPVYIIVYDGRYGNDIHAYGTEAEQDAELRKVMEQRLITLRKYGEGPTNTAAAELGRLLAAGNIAEAWVWFDDPDNGARHPDECYWVEQIEIEVPINAVSAKAIESARKIIEAIADNPYTLTPDQWASEARQALKCRQCGEPTDNGEGWDGLCGNCADKAERKETNGT